MISIIKRAALEAVEMQKPTALLFGTVTSEDPLQIMAEQKLLLKRGQLVLCGGLCEREVEVEIDAETGLAGEPTHSHSLPKKTKLKLTGGLKEGDKVLLLRMTGGQKYIIVDRVVEE